MSGTTALNILWTSEGDSNMVARAVKVLTDSGETLVINAIQEIILAAGTYRTPALLEYSGVGNSRSAPHFFYFELIETGQSHLHVFRILSKYGINTMIDLPGVGENL